jgi:hypothetical protein
VILNNYSLIGRRIGRASMVPCPIRFVLILWGGPFAVKGIFLGDGALIAIGKSRSAKDSGPSNAEGNHADQGT